MPGLFDLIQSAMGRPDPRAQLAAAFGQAPGQPGSPAGPMPIAGPQAAAGGPPSAGPAPPPPTGAGPPGGAPGAPQGPQAYQSPPDLSAAYAQLAQPSTGAQAAQASTSAQPSQAQPMPNLVNLYLAAAQRQQASENFDRHLGLLAASAYPGRRPDIVMQGMTDPHQDIGAMMGNILQLHQAAQQEAQYQAFVRSAPDLASKLGMTPDEVVAAGPTALNTAIAANAPTEQMRTYAQAKRMLSAQGYSDADIEKMMPVELLAAGAEGMSPDYKQFVAERSQATSMLRPGEQLDPRFNTFTNWQVAKAGDMAEGTAIKKDQAASMHDFSNQNADYNKVEMLLAGLNANPDAAIAAIRTPLPTTGTAGLTREWLGKFGVPGGMQADVAAAAGNLKQLQDILYSEGWRGRGSRLSQTEASRLSDAWTQLNNAALPPDQIRAQLQQLQEQEMTAHANVFGAAGQATPDKYWGRMDPIYKQPNSKMFAGASPLGDSAKGPSGGPTDLRSSRDPDGDYEKLPSGAVFIAPDGQQRRKP